MKQIQKLLARYTHLKAPEKTKKQIIIATIKKHTDIVLENHELHLKPHSIHLVCHAVIRSEIKEKEKAILRDISTELNEHYEHIF